ncbi:hypothetical protein RvY_13126 [Ramazzottius varieornatus]|uniref:Uncharacterized protein n=1 Tax=Ramazzottius varieornatus TaxID=947166 RepID=A0A1D1VLU8_RAMVA|nr:hypothetical protein RvY_13126 [Ramazzottius varieornatus]
MPALPAELENLHRSSRKLRDQSRMYNNLFSMSVRGTSGCSGQQTGPSNVVLRGQTYHRMLPGNPASGPLRWYVNDAEYPNEVINDLKMDRDIVKKLRTILFRCNPLLHQLGAIRTCAT